jgi:hypothetical protein
MPREVRCLPPEGWGAALEGADQVAVCVSTPGLQATMRAAAARARPDAVWVLAKPAHC